MSARLDRYAAGRWLLPVLVVPLVLGHVCDVAAFAHFDAHHQPDHRTADQELSSCDAMPAAANPGPARIGPTPAVMVALPVIDEKPAKRVGSIVEGHADLVGRPPLFLLYASLLI